MVESMHVTKPLTSLWRRDAAVAWERGKVKGTSEQLSCLQRCPNPTVRRPTGSGAGVGTKLSIPLIRFTVAVLMPGEAQLPIWEVFALAAFAAAALAAAAFVAAALAAAALAAAAWEAAAFAAAALAAAAAALACVEPEEAAGFVGAAAGAEFAALAGSDETASSAEVVSSAVAASEVAASSAVEVPSAVAASDVAASSAVAVASAVSSVVSVEPSVYPVSEGCHEASRNKYQWPQNQCRLHLLYLHHHRRDRRSLCHRRLSRHH